MSNIKLIQKLIKSNKPEQLNTFFKSTIPSKSSESQYLYNKIVEELFKQDDLKNKNVVSELKDAIRSRLFGVSSNDPDSIKEANYYRRLSSYNDILDYLDKKEHNPITRIFSKEELSSKYIPYHAKRGSNFTKAQRKDYISRKKLDSVFDEIEAYRESPSFKNFKGDEIPELTKKEKEEVYKNFVKYYIDKNKKPKTKISLPREYSNRYLALIKKSKNKLYPEQDPSTVHLTEEQQQILRDFALKRNIPVYKPKQYIESSALKSAYDKAEYAKYMNKPQKLLQDNDYDGTTFADLMEYIDNY